MDLVQLVADSSHLQVGTVVEGQGTGSTKKLHDGQEYDFVFDIDIEEGKPPLKLPYNLTESAWDAARKFLEKNELPMSYYEQVANWISENTKGARIGHDSASSTQQPSQVSDPWGTERRYRPGHVGSSSASGQRKIPQRSYVDIIEGNPTNAINIIAQKADELVKSGDVTAEQGLRPEEISAIESLPTQLQNKQDAHPTEPQITALLKVASQWPAKNRVPAVGILALLAVAPSFVSATSAGDHTVVDSLAKAGLLAPGQPTANNVVHSIRLLVNLFQSNAGRLIADGTFDTVIKLVRPFNSQPESVAQVKALASLYLNYAVLLSSGVGNEGAVRESRARTLITDIAMLLECESPHATDPDSFFRTLAALGTLLSIGGNFRESLKGGIAGSLQFAAMRPGAQQPDTKALIQEIRDELR